MSFLENLYSQCIAHGFFPVSHDAVPVADAAGFTLAKEENAALCLVQAADLSRLSTDICLYLRNVELERAKALSGSYSSVWVVFLWISDETSPVIENAEGYYGQSPYALYWHINSETSQITVAPGQPDDIMGLKAALQAEEAPQIEEKRTQPPICTFILALTNILIMILMYLRGFAERPVEVAAHFGAIIPPLVWEGAYYRLLTAMFVHFGWTHLLFNIAGMLIFGIRIERYYGKGSFLAIYFISGLSASVASLLLTQGISAGASGAVYGLLGAAFVYTRYTKRAMDIINKHVILIYIILGLGMGFVMPNIDYFGHIGGLIAGSLVGLAALKLEERK